MNDGIVYAWMIFIVEKVRKNYFSKNFFGVEKSALNKELLRTMYRYTYICKNLSR